MKLRASSLPLVSQCAPAAIPPGARIEIGDAAVPAMGSAVHAVIAARMTMAGRCDLGEIAERFQVDLSELDAAAGVALRCVAEVRQFFRNPVSELALGIQGQGVELTGTCDLAEFDPVTKEVRGLDFKTGWLDYDASQQCKAYAFLLMKRYGAERVWFGQLNVRSKSLVASLWTAEHLEAWWAWLKRHLAEQVYRPSYSACGNCKRWHECPAGEQLTITAIGQVANVHSDWLDNLTGEAAISAIERCRFVEKAAATARELVKIYVARNGGKVTCEDGSYLELNKQNRRKVQFTVAAAAILAETIGQAMYDLHLSVGEIEDAVGATAPRGSKKWLVQKTFKALEECGALKVEVSDRLDVRAAPKQIGVA